MVRIEHATDQFGGGDEGAMGRALHVEQFQPAAEQGRIAGRVVALAGVVPIALPHRGCPDEALRRFAGGPGLCGAWEEQQRLPSGGLIRLDQAAQAMAQLLTLLRTDGVEHARRLGDQHAGAALRAADLLQ